MPQEFDQIEYYGEGPQENYIDRRNWQHIRVWNQTVAEQYYPYIRPQESGTKVGVRYWQLTNAQGKGLKFEGTAPLECQALNYTEDDLYSGRDKSRTQRHSGDLTPPPLHRPPHRPPLNGPRLRQQSRKREQSQACGLSYAERSRLKTKSTPGAHGHARNTKCPTRTTPTPSSSAL